MLFEPFEFSGMKLKNRVVSVPVVSDMATEDGFVTDNLVERYRRIAEGRTGWIIYGLRVALMFLCHFYQNRKEGLGKNLCSLRRQECQI
jgi:2,4-dienoyl-CoA reductase-like NADH-dependent reductase (Old Yellow Enzyme family)